MPNQNRFNKINNTCVNESCSNDSIGPALMEHRHRHIRYSIQVEEVIGHGRG